MDERPPKRRTPKPRPTAEEIALYINDLESSLADFGAPLITNFDRMKLVRGWASDQLPRQDQDVTTHGPRPHRNGAERPPA